MAINVKGQITLAEVFDGDKGSDGATLYTWVKYATSASGANMSNTPTGKSYIGFAYNKPTATASNNAADYTWSKFEGDQGVPGVAGKDGKTTYTWIKYADDEKGNGMSDSPDGKRYLGLAYNKPTATESTNKADYTWSPLYDNVIVGGRNLFKNSTFNMDLKNWWVGDATKSTIDNTGGVDGGKCLKIVGTTGKATNVSQPIVLKPDTMYTLTGWYKSENIVHGTINPYIRFHLAYYAQDNTYKGEIALSSQIAGTNGWTKVTKTFTTRKANDWNKAHFACYARDFTGTVWFDQLQIEESNVASDWTPAPEDIDTVITDVNNEMNRVDEVLADISSDSKLTPSEKLLIKKDFDAIVSEKSTIESQANTYSITTEKTNYVNSYKVLYDYVNPKLSNLTVTTDVNGVALRSYFKDYYSKKAALLKKISDSAKGLVDNIQIGARNYIKNGTFNRGITDWSLNNAAYSTVVTGGQDGGNCMKIVGAMSNSTVVSQRIYNLKKNTQYTFTGWYKSENVVHGTTNPSVRFLFSYEKGSKFVAQGKLNDSVSGTNGWTKVVVTFTTRTTDDWDNIYFACHARDFTGTFYCDQLCLVEGNKGVEWVPAPEDTDAEISKINGKINNAITTIDETGVTVKDGNFGLTSSVGGKWWTFDGRTLISTQPFKNHLLTLQNEIKDHSFEMLETTGNIGSDYYFAIKPTTVADRVGRWGTTGSPAIYDAVKANSNTPEVPFGNKYVICDLNNYVIQKVKVVGNQWYTLSFHVKTVYNRPSGTPQVYFQLLGDDAVVQPAVFVYPAKHSTNYSESVRYAVTFKTPNTMSHYAKSEVAICLRSTYPGEWVGYDGIQLVLGDKPVTYNPDTEAWNLRNGVDKYPSINGGAVVASTITSTGTITSNGTITGNLKGNVTGNVTGSISGGTVAGTSVTASGTVKGATVTSTGTVTASGTITGGNITTSGTLTANTLRVTGKVSNGYNMASIRDGYTNHNDAMLIQNRVVAVPVSSSTSGYVDVTFPTAFSASPIWVVAQPTNSNSFTYNAGVYNISSTGCRIYVANINNAATTLSISVQVVACGRRS